MSGGKHMSAYDGYHHTKISYKNIMMDGTTSKYKYIVDENGNVIRKKKKEECFRDSDKVIVLKNGTECTISAADVCVGDSVKTLRDDYQKVYYIYVPHGSQKCDDTVSVILLSFKSNESFGVIGLTECHLLYDGDGNLKPAKQFKINDIIQTSTGDAVITEIIMGQTKGVRSIITSKGELLLNGVRVSSYSGTPVFAKYIHTLSIPLQILAGLTNKSAIISKYIVDFVRQNIFDRYNNELIHKNDVTQIKKIMMKEAIYLFCYFVFICLFVICFISFVLNII